MRIIMDGATGRLCSNQHLRGLMAMRADGGFMTAAGERVLPEPILLGRDPAKLAALAAANGGLAWSTDRDACLGDAANAIYFDAGATAGRAQRARSAMAAGKHVYLEKPVAETLHDAIDLVRQAANVETRSGVVQDKLFLPGFAKMGRVRQSGELGRILTARLDFGWWIFDGITAPAQRSSWNYRRSAGGGLVLDMFPHWRYIVDELVGAISAVSCRLATATTERGDETGVRFSVDVEDTALATLQTEAGALVQVSSSWATRVKRDDLLVLQVDGTGGSALCGLHRCFVQKSETTPRPVWNVDTDSARDFDADWDEVPDVETYKNPYRAGWELFLRHILDGTPFPSPLRSGAKGLQLIDACYRSDREQRWIELEPIE